MSSSSSSSLKETDKSDSMAIPHASPVANTNTTSRPPNAENPCCSCKSKSDCLVKFCPCFKAGEICDAGICSCSAGDCLNYAGSLQLIEERRRTKDKAGLAYAQKVFDEHWSTYGTDTNTPEKESTKTTTAKKAQAKARAEARAEAKATKTKSASASASAATKTSPASRNRNELPLPVTNQTQIVLPMMMSPTAPMQMNHSAFPFSASPPTNRFSMIPPHLHHNRLGGSIGITTMGTTPMPRVQGQLTPAGVTATTGFTPMQLAQRDLPPTIGAPAITRPNPVVYPPGTFLHGNEPALGMNPMLWAPGQLHGDPTMGQPNPMLGGQQLQPPTIPVPPQVSMYTYVQNLRVEVGRLEQQLEAARVTNQNILDAYNKYRKENPSRNSNGEETAETQKPRAISSTPNELNNGEYDNNIDSNMNMNININKEDNIFSLKYRIEKLEKRCTLEHNMRLAESRKAKKAQAKHESLVKCYCDEIEDLKRERALNSSSVSSIRKRARAATMRAINYKEDEVSDDDESIRNSNSKRCKNKTIPEEPKPRGKPGPKPKPVPPTVFEQAEKNHKQAIKWVENFNFVKAYKEANGHCNVPRSRNAKVWQWITDLRTHHRCLTQGKPNSLTPDKIRILDSIGFQWRVGSVVRTWEQNFERLKAYAQQHGHCRVSQKKPGKGYEGLGNWVLTHRHYYLNKSKHLNAEKIKKLEGIGFEWSLRNRGGTLEERMAASEAKNTEDDGNGDGEDYHDDCNSNGNERNNGEDEDDDSQTIGNAVDSSPTSTRNNAEDEDDNSRTIGNAVESTPTSTTHVNFISPIETETLFDL